MRQTAMRPGSSGPFVREMQMALNSRLNPSPNLMVSGVFDLPTGRAVRAFQAANWLEVDGCAGPCTLDVLYSLEKSGPFLHPITPVNRSANIPAWAAALAMLRGVAAGAILAATPTALLTATGELAMDTDPTHHNHLRHELGMALGLRYQPPRSWTAPALVAQLRSGPLAIEIPQTPFHFGHGVAAVDFLLIAGARGSHGRDGSSTTLRVIDPSGGQRSQTYAALMHQMKDQAFGFFNA